MKFTAIIILGIGSLLTYCQQELKSAEPVIMAFDSVPIAKPIIPLINEISGIADSKANPGIIWGHEDSGRPPQLFMIGHNGAVNKKIFLKGITNRDWEEMTLSNNKIIIGEIGDNMAVYGDYRFFILDEPVASTDTVTQIETRIRMDHMMPKHFWWIRFQKIFLSSQNVIILPGSTNWLILIITIT